MSGPYAITWWWWNTLNPKSAGCGRWGCHSSLPTAAGADSYPMNSVMLKTNSCLSQCLRRTVAFPAALGVWGLFNIRKKIPFPHTRPDTSSLPAETKKEGEMDPEESGYIEDILSPKNLIHEIELESHPEEGFSFIQEFRWKILYFCLLFN